jgi:hypothetical protein
MQFNGLIPKCWDPKLASIVTSDLNLLRLSTTIVPLETIMITILATLTPITETIGGTVAILMRTAGEKTDTVAKVTAVTGTTGETMTTLVTLMAVRAKFQIIWVKPMTLTEHPPLIHNLEILNTKKGVPITVQETK